jgi:hypothetical protein
VCKRQKRQVVILSGDKIVPAVTYCFYLEEWNCGKDIGFNLMGCAPNVLQVLRICGWSEQWNSIRETLLND